MQRRERPCPCLHTRVAQQLPVFSVFLSAQPAFRNEGGQIHQQTKQPEQRRVY
jgi:hypothetical protein